MKIFRKYLFYETNVLKLIKNGDIMFVVFCCCCDSSIVNEGKLS